MNKPWTTETAPRGAGRRAKKYCFTISEIARAAALEERTVKKHIRLELLSLTDLRSIARYICDRTRDQ